MKFLLEGLAFCFREIPRFLTIRSVANVHLERPSFAPGTQPAVDWIWPAGCRKPIPRQSVGALGSIHA